MIWERAVTVSSSYDLSKHGLDFAERMGSTSTNPNMARLQNYRNADAVDYEGGSAGRTLNATGGDFTWLFAGRGLRIDASSAANANTPAIKIDGSGVLSFPRGITTTSNAQFGRVSARGTGNDYNLGGLMTQGNDATNTVHPTIGFLQNTLYGCSIQSRGNGDFRLYMQGGVNYGSLTCNTITLGGIATWTGGNSTNANLAFAHIGSTGDQHTWLDQGVTTGSSPTFNALSLVNANASLEIGKPGNANTPYIEFPYKFSNI